jgi:hypothetical protein
VRHTPYHTGKLAVLDKDADDRPFVLVRGTPPKLEVVGWMFGKDAKQEHWRDSNKKRKPFMVPSSELVPINNSRIGAEPTPSQAAPEISNNS